MNSLGLAAGLMDLDNPDPKFFDPQVIAHALSQICRFTGHTREFWSVAEHCLLVVKSVSLLSDQETKDLGVNPKDYKNLQLQALLHDASEAFLGDVSTPIKSMLPQYKIIEKEFEHRIYDRFKVVRTKESDAIVKAADLMCLKFEAETYLIPEGATEPWVERIQIEKPFDRIYKVLKTLPPRYFKHPDYVCRRYLAKLAELTD